MVLESLNSNLLFVSIKKSIIAVFVLIFTVVMGAITVLKAAKQLHLI